MPLLSKKNKNIILILLISFTINSFGYLMATSTITDERLYMKEAYFMQRNGSFPRVYPFLPILSSMSLTFFGVTKQSFLFIPMLASALTAALVYLFSLNLYNDDKRALLSALILISNPLMIWLSSKQMTEALFTLMLTETFYLIARENLSLKQAFLGGFFSLLAYFTKYPGLLLILFMILSLAWIKRPKLLMAFLMPISFLAFYWTYNSLQFGTPFPSEEYSLSMAQGLMNINLKLALDIVFKIMLGLTLLLAYLMPTLILPIKSLRKKISYSTLSNLPFFKRSIVLFIPFYSLFHIGYYILISLVSQIAWSADHVARYLLPIVPLIVLFANFPFKKRSWRIAFAIIIMGIGIILGYYLIIYSNVKAQASIPWDDFLSQLTEL
ncbi:MAG: glycosyltransferase family 39 protein [archaeon]|nr:glycosyltransferase family 39 protein [archaeon]